MSIIMRCKDSDWVIASALGALFSQEYQDFELIVVDSGSTDRTLEIVKAYPCRLIEIEPKAYFPGKVLNDAIAKAQGALIVLLNSDSVLLTPKSLGNLVDCFERKETIAAFGRQIPRPEAHTWVKADYQRSFPANGSAPPWLALSFPLAAIRRSAWHEHPFYTLAWASEDTEWGCWAKSKGYDIAYEPMALTMHSHNYTLRELYGRRFVEGEADAFIHRLKMSKTKTFLNWVKSCASDFQFHIKEGDWWGLFAIPVRRFVYHWAHAKGNQLGHSRIMLGNIDVSVGQSVVLRSYQGEAR